MTDNIENIGFKPFLIICLFAEFICLNELYGILYKTLKPTRELWWLGIILAIVLFRIGSKSTEKNFKIAFYLLGLYSFLSQLIRFSQLKIAFLIEILSFGIIIPMSCYFYYKGRLKIDYKDTIKTDKLITAIVFTVFISFILTIFIVWIIGSV